MDPGNKKQFKKIIQSEKYQQQKKSIVITLMYACQQLKMI